MAESSDKPPIIDPNDPYMGQIIGKVFHAPKKTPDSSIVSTHPTSLSSLSEFIKSELDVAEASATSSLAGTEEGRVGPPRVMFDIHSNVGSFVVDRDRLGLCSQSNFSSIRANVCIHGGKWQYELMLGSKGVMQVGWATVRCKFSQEKGVGDTLDSYAYDGNRVRKWNMATYKYGESWLTGDVIGCVADLDVGTIMFYRNGHTLGMAFDDVQLGPSIAYFPAVSLAYSENLVANFGATPFMFPVSGYRPLQAPNVRLVAHVECYLTWLSRLVYTIYENESGSTKVEAMDTSVELSEKGATTSTDSRPSDSIPALSSPPPSKPTLSWQTALYLITNHVLSPLGPVLAASAYATEACLLPFFHTLQSDSTELIIHCLDLLWGVIDPVDMHYVLDHAIVGLLTAVRFAPSTVGFHEQKKHLRLTVSLLKHTQTRHWLLQNTLFDKIKFPVFLHVKPLDTEGLNSAIPTVWWDVPSQDGKSQQDDHLEQKEVYKGAVGVLKKAVNELEDLQVELLLVLLDDSDVVPGVKTKNGESVSTRDLFLNKLREFLRENMAGSRVHPVHLCPLPVTLCFFHRLIRALRLVWDKAYANGELQSTSTAESSATPSDSIVVPIHAFIDGKMEYFDIQRIGGLISHIQKALSKEISQLLGHNSDQSDDATPPFDIPFRTPIGIETSSSGGFHMSVHVPGNPGGLELPPTAEAHPSSMETDSPYLSSDPGQSSAADRTTGSAVSPPNLSIRPGHTDLGPEPSLELRRSSQSPGPSRERSGISETGVMRTSTPDSTGQPEDIRDDSVNRMASPRHQRTQKRTLPLRHRSTPEALLELADGLVLLYHIAAHKQLGKMCTLRESIQEHATALIGSEAKLQRSRGNSDDEAGVVDALKQAHHVFLEKLSEQCRHMGWVEAVIYSADRQQDVYWLLKVSLRTLNSASQHSSLFAAVPDFYVDVTINACSALRNYFPPSSPTDALLAFHETLVSVASFLTLHFGDRRVLLADVKDSLIQALASFVCQPDTLQALESMHSEHRKAMVTRLLQPYENRAWAQSNWILLRCWKGHGFAFRYTKPPHLLRRNAPHKPGSADSTALTGQYHPPHPSHLFQAQVAECLLGDPDGATAFLNSVLNQLNWAFSEFIGMLQEIQNASNRPERVFIDSRQLRICATCFDLAVALLRVLEMVAHVVPQLFTTYSWPSAEPLLSRLCQLLCAVLNRVTSRNGCFDHVVYMEIPGLESVDHFPVLTAVTGIMCELILKGSEESRVVAARAMVSDPSFQLSSIEYLLQRHTPSTLGRSISNATQFSLYNFPGDVSPREFEQIELLLAALTQQGGQVSGAETDTIRDDELCFICYARRANATFQPCRHISCRTCITHHLMNRNDCFFCKAQIREVIDSSGKTIFTADADGNITSA